MKILLTIFCAAAALFGGGCGAILLTSGGAFALIPLAILVLNGLILYGLWGAATPWTPAFYVLGIIDMLIAAGIVLFMSSDPGFRNSDMAPFFIIPLAFAAKGVLTLIYARQT